jgi:hypothetical protein
MKALDDTVGLRAFDLGASVIDVLHRQVELVLVPLGAPEYSVRDRSESD